MTKKSKKSTKKTHTRNAWTAMQSDGDWLERDKERSSLFIVASYFLHKRSQKLESGGSNWGPKGRKSRPKTESGASGVLVEDRHQSLC